MGDWPRIPLEDDFVDVLRKALRGSKRSPEELARAVGTTTATVDRWVQGDGVPEAAAVHAIAAFLGLDPGNLADSAARRWYPPPIERPDVRRHPQEPHPSSGYVFFLEKGRCAALVDPAGTAQNLVRRVREGEYRLQYVLVTHKHADHCDAASAVARAFPQAQLVMHEADVHAIGALANRTLLVRDGQVLPFGESAEIRMLHTPGHTDGSTCYLVNSTLFSGDTLFAASVGGAFGDRSGYADILTSIRTRLFTLPDDTVVMPGHGPPTTIGLEKAHNPFFPHEAGDYVRSL